MLRGDLVLLPTVVAMLLLCASAGPAVPTAISRSGEYVVGGGHWLGTKVQSRKVSP